MKRILTAFAIALAVLLSLFLYQIDKPDNLPTSDLASPSQEIRDAAAKVLRATAKPPSKIKWFFFTCHLKKGETETNIFELLMERRMVRRQFVFLPAKLNLNANIATTQKLDLKLNTMKTAPQIQLKIIPSRDSTLRLEFSPCIFPAIHPASIQSIPGQAGGGTTSVAAWQIAASSAGGAADSSPQCQLWV